MNMEFQIVDGRFCVKGNLKGVNNIGFFNVMIAAGGMIAVIEHILMNLETLVFIVPLSGDLIIWLDEEWSEDNEIN